MKKTIKEIKEKIKKGKAVIMTAKELCEIIRDGEKVSMKDIDVVTCATRALMSGTMSILSFSVAEKNVFMKALEVYLNGVPAIPGPAPNEYLGYIDCVIHGTSKSKTLEKYGGGHLFRDMVEGKEIDIFVKTIEGKEINVKRKLIDMPYAKIYCTRGVCNHMVFINPATEPFRTIFSVNPLAGNFTEASFCGCGEVSPLKKDPFLQTIGVGTRVLINGNIGYILDKGTLCAPNRPNLSGIADMHKMIPEYMGGFITSYGPEVITSWAVPIPILNDSVLKTATMLDEELTIPIVNVRGRTSMDEAKFNDVWIKKGYNVGFNRNKCIIKKDDKNMDENVPCCNECIIEELCPTNAFTIKNGIKPKICFHCGTCVAFCPGKAFFSKMGSVNCQDKKIPIVLRHSDRLRADKLTERLKKLIISGEFEITDPLEKIKF